MSEVDRAPSTTGSEDGWFKTTQWSAVLQVGAADEAQVQQALTRLCHGYWQPLYMYVRRRGHSAEDAEDLTQEFFARILEKKWIERADPNRGKFRCFLLAMMNNFLANDWRRGQAAKRGGGRAIISLDDTAEAHYQAEAASDVTPERLYERRCALLHFERALNQLRLYYESTGKLELYASLKDFLSAEADDGDYARLAKVLGMSQAAVNTAVHRLRQRYRELVREEIARTVLSADEIDDEVRSLLAALA
jgi:RNA polymerase sigma-70 factor (ECF subfamily)